MDRRRTLGGLSPGHLNSRATLAPARVAKDGKGMGASGKLPLERALARMSLAGPVMRRSSQYTTAKSSGFKYDPRPISDKGFQQNCIRTIISFLQANNYEHQINAKVRST